MSGKLFLILYIFCLVLFIYVILSKILIFLDPRVDYQQGTTAPGPQTLWALKAKGCLCQLITHLFCNMHHYNSLKAEMPWGGSWILANLEAWYFAFMLRNLCLSKISHNNWLTINLGQCNNYSLGILVGFGGMCVGGGSRGANRAFLPRDPPTG